MKINSIALYVPQRRLLPISTYSNRIWNTKTPFLSSPKQTLPVVETSTRNFNSPETPNLELESERSERSLQLDSSKWTLRFESVAFTTWKFRVEPLCRVFAYFCSHHLPNSPRSSPPFRTFSSYSLLAFLHHHRPLNRPNCLPKPHLNHLNHLRNGTQRSQACPAVPMIVPRNWFSY